MEMESFDKHVVHEPYHHPSNIGHHTTSPPSIGNGGVMHPGHQLSVDGNAIAMDLTNELWLHANASAAAAAAAATHHNGDFDAYHNIKEPQPLQPPSAHPPQFNNNSIDFLSSSRNQFDPYDIEYHHSNGEFIEQPHQYEFYEASGASVGAAGATTASQPSFEHHQPFSTGAYTTFHPGVNEYHHLHHHPEDHLVKTFSV